MRKTKNIVTCNISKAVSNKDKSVFLNLCTRCGKTSIIQALTRVKTENQSK